MYDFSQNGATLATATDAAFLVPWGKVAEVGAAGVVGAVGVACRFQVGKKVVLFSKEVMLVLKNAGRSGKKALSMLFRGAKNGQYIDDVTRVERLLAPKSRGLVPVGKYLNTVDDVLANPQLLKGKTAAEVEAILGKTPGWRVGALGKGSHRGQGWILREYNTAGKPTGRMLRWHPGGGHHGPNPYWRVNSHNTKSPMIPAGPRS